MNKEDILIKDIEKEYDIDFDVHGDMKLVNYLKKKGLPSLAKLLDKVIKQNYE